MFWQQWNLQHIQHQEHKFVQGTSTWKLTQVVGKWDLKKETLLPTSGQNRKKLRRKMLSSQTLGHENSDSFLQKSGSSLTSVKKYKCFPWTGQNGMERGNWIYLWVCLPFLLNPRMWHLDHFSFHIQNPSPESKINKICVSRTEAVFGPKNSMTK